MAPTKPTPNPTPSLNYKSLYPWALDDLLAETSSLTSFESIAEYKKGETYPKSRVFGKEHNRFVKVMPCGKGESMCADESSDQRALYVSFTPSSSRARPPH